MNKKGLTLIELIAVIALIALVAALIFPNVNRILNKTKKSGNTVQRSAIVEAAKLYVADHIGETVDFDETPRVEITLKQLVDGGYVNSNPKNPDNDKYYNLNTSKIIVTKDANNNYNYTLNLNT